MSDTHFVARTATGLSHGNTLVLRMPWTVVIYLDSPGDPQDVQDSYQLLSDDGLYDRTMQRAEAVRNDEHRLALRFTEVVPEGNYSLYHRMPSGAEFPVFRAVPFEVLEEYGEATPELSNETLEGPSLEPEPQLISGDPLLLHHPVDHALPAVQDDQADPSQADEEIA